MGEDYHANNNGGALPPAPSPASGRTTVTWSNAKACATNPEKDQYQFKPPAHHGGSKLRESIRCSKRRIIQQLLVKLKQAEASDDSEYQALRARQMALYDDVLTLIMQVKNFATNLVALGHGAGMIGESANNISTPQSRLGSTAVAAVASNQEFMVFDPDFCKSMDRVESTGRELAGTTLSTVGAALEKKLEALMTLKKEMEDRENFKLDFDSAVRKLRLAKEKGRPEDVVRRDVKLQAARSVLGASTEAIVKKFMYYESARSTFIYHELKMFREQQSKFFTQCANAFQVQEHPELGDD